MMRKTKPNDNAAAPGGSPAAVPSSVDAAALAAAMRDDLPFVLDVLGGAAQGEGAEGISNEAPDGGEKGCEKRARFDGDDSEEIKSASKRAKSEKNVNNRV